MKRFMKWVALLAVMTLVLGGLAACGGSSSEAETPAEDNAVSGNWYIVDGSDVTTLKLDAEGGGSLGGETVSYELDGESLTLTIDGEAIDLKLAEDINYGTVLNDGTDIFAYREKDAAKDVAANGEIDKSQDTGIADSEAEESESTENPSAVLPGNVDPGMKEYVGTWVGESFEYSGTTMSLEEADMTFSITFEADGTATASTNGESDGSATWTVNSDGSITLTDGTGELPEHSYIDESGVLHLALDASDGTMWILCEKQ